MDVSTIAAKITALIQEVHADGVKKGRDLEYEEGVQTMIEALTKRRETKSRTRSAAARKAHEPQPQPEPEAPLPETTPPDPIRQRIEEALSELANDHSDGVYPDALADNTGIKVRDVRAVLRNMLLTGKARRMARGKYLPSHPLLNLNHAAQ